MPAHGVCSCHRLFGGALARTAHQRGYATRVFVLSRPRSTTEGIPNRASVLVGTPSVAVAIHVAAADEYNQQTTAFPRVPPPRRTVPHLGFRFCPVHERPPVVFVYRVFLRVPTVGTRVLMEEAHERLHRSTPQSVLRGHLRGPRPGDRQGAAPLAPRRHRPCRSRRVHDQARRGGDPPGSAAERRGGKECARPCRSRCTPLP